MNAQPALADDLEELFEPYLASVILLTSAAGHETTVVDGEDESVKELFVPTIEGDVYEYSVHGSRHEL